MGERLSGGNIAVALLANSVATGGALVALILTFGPVSGAHFNPAVTLGDATQGGVSWRDAALYVASQVVGAFAGAAAATALFRWLVPKLPEEADAVVVPHVGTEGTHASKEEGRE
jgi:glycerol uptake facilitator-like aquaporin